MASFTFKKEPRLTGLMSVGHHHQNVHIKVNKKRVGMINAPSWQTTDHCWSIGLTIKKDKPDDNPNCDWKWLFFKQKFAEEADARQWLKDHYTQIVEKYTLHVLDD